MSGYAPHARHDSACRGFVCNQTCCDFADHAREYCCLCLNKENALPNSSLSTQEAQLRDSPPKLHREEANLSEKDIPTQENESQEDAECDIGEEEGYHVVLYESGRWLGDWSGWNNLYRGARDIEWDRWNGYTIHVCVVAIRKDSTNRECDYGR